MHEGVSQSIIRFGVIGAGNIAKRFAMGIPHVAGARLTHVWARNPGAAQAFSTMTGAETTDSLDALLACDIDAVYIATLHDSHAQYSEAALKAGKAVLCEKPAALNETQLEGVLATAGRHQCLFMEAMKPPFYPLYRQLREHLARDPIGDIVFVRAGFANVVAPDHSVFKLQHGGGALLDIGIYPAFLAVDWLGAPLAVQSMGRRGPSGVDLFASVQCRHERGISEIYCSIDSTGKGDALLSGTGGHIEIHEKWWNPAHATIHYADGRQLELHADFQGGGLNYETGHFCDLLRQGKTESPVMSHDHSRQMIRILTQARQSLGVVFPGEG